MMRIPMPHRIAAALRRLAKNRGGNVAVEFGLGAPVLFLIIFGVVELGYALWLQNALDESVAAAARCASISVPLSPISNTRLLIWRTPRCELSSGVNEIFERFHKALI